MGIAATRLVGALVVALAIGLGAPAVARAATPWCGNDRLATDRVPDAVGGPQTHVVYAIPSDGADRFGDVASAIATDVAAVEAWWRREDPSRAPRFDLFPFLGCAAGMGRLDLSLVRLPQPASAYFAVAGRAERLANDLWSSGHAHPYKKYLVYYDGLVESANICGTAFRTGEAGGRMGLAAVWLQSRPGFPGCGTLGAEDYLAKVAAHELIHQLGAEPPGAPHPCPDDEGHTCDDVRDVMQGGGGRFPTLAEYSLDVGRDDYYGHAGSWLDVQDSAWLQRLDSPDLPLTVALSGGGATDTVTSDVPGIACPPACSTSLEPGTRVRLDASANGSGTRFVGWRGACAGADSCELVLGEETSVEAVFGPAWFRVAVRVAGGGRVVGAGFACARACSSRFSADDTLTLRARPRVGWRFAGWSGACRGRTACRVLVSANRQVVATFRRV
jgi:hypothetical protein